jgi:histidinol dehydrogenase
VKIPRLDSRAADFSAQLEALIHWEQPETDSVEAVVRAILTDVKARGDAALLEYTRRFDRREVQSGAAITLQPAQLRTAWDSLPSEQQQALDRAAQRIRVFHEHQVERSWSFTEADGTVLGQQVSAIERAGIYVPGGTAAYPSSVLMNAIPAKVAGVEELVMVVPAPDEHLNPLVAAAAYVAGVDKLFTVGGAQAVAALAYGTETVPAVDKIVGPGNIYVATAKRMVFGVVGIDMVAGPSEILILSDGTVAPAWLAMDLFAQAEHDELARAVLISPDPQHLDEVEREIMAALPTMSRRDIIEVSLATRGALIQVVDMQEAAALANRIAAEHVELAVAEPQALLPLIRHAGAVFLGSYSPEAFGDYCAGPNHVLPTARTARFSSPLGVYDFQKRSSVIHCSASGADTLAPLAATLAYGEGLQAHARSAELRLGNRQR